MRYKNILDYDQPLSYKRMIEYLDEFTGRYKDMSLSYLGESILGRKIPIITLGEGKKSVLYVGAHHGMEWITSIVLLRFINEYFELLRTKSRIFNFNMEYLFATKTIYVIPMLNPDGVEYQINGVSSDNPLYERLISMNGGSTDFSRWQANARGVDLNHNYSSGFLEYKKIESEQGICNGAPTRFSGNEAESEPEVARLCNFLRFNENINLILTLHSQGQEIYYTSGDKMTPRSTLIAGAISRMSGYSLSRPEGMACYGGLTDWCISELSRPAFTIECGKGTNPLPVTKNFEIYTRLREVFFTMPQYA